MRHPSASWLTHALAVFVLATAAGAESLPHPLDAPDQRGLKQVPGGARIFTDRMVRSSQIYPSTSGCQRITSPEALLERSRISLSVWRREIAAAFAMWEAVSNLRFLEVDNVSADILIGAQANPDGADVVNAGYDVLVPDHVQPRARALICLDPDAGWTVGLGGNAGTSALRYTIAYEIGQAIGLDLPAKGRAMERQRGDAVDGGGGEAITASFAGSGRTRAFESAWGHA
jgi:hypothetical protein